MTRAEQFGVWLGEWSAAILRALPFTFGAFLGWLILRGLGTEGWPEPIVWVWITLAYACGCRWERDR